MPGPSVVFNSLSSLYFEIESGGGDACLCQSLALDQLSDQLSLVKSAGGLGLPHEEGACLFLPLCAQKMKRSKINCTDDSASFVLGERKTTHI
jgi:hypothetical protein